MDRTQWILAGCFLMFVLSTSTLCIFQTIQLSQERQFTSQLKLELALAKTENRVLAQKLAACQTVEREPKPILNF